MEKGGAYKESAVLYRSNAQSRAIEEALLRVSIPYRIYGGLRFYERLEIKNAIAYLRVIFNHNDNPSFERSISNPTRGVGEKTLAKIRYTAKEFNISYIKASAKLIDDGRISGRGGAGLRDYLEFIAGCKSFIEENLLSELMEFLHIRMRSLVRGAEPLGESVSFKMEKWLELLDLHARISEYISQIGNPCLLYTSPSPRDGLLSRMPSSA